jgi:hypothetical protein
MNTIFRANKKEEILRQVDGIFLPEINTYVEINGKQYRVEAVGIFIDKNYIGVNLEEDD